jgi:very-short-patch-repair endonuclease
MSDDALKQNARNLRNQATRMEYDIKRTEYFHELNIEVLRFSNTEIKKNLQGVCYVIEKAVEELLSKEEKLSQI